MFWLAMQPVIPSALGCERSQRIAGKDSPCAAELGKVPSLFRDGLTILAALLAARLEGWLESTLQGPPRRSRRRPHSGDQGAANINSASARSSASSGQQGAGRGWATSGAATARQPRIIPCQRAGRADHRCSPQSRPGHARPAPRSPAPARRPPRSAPHGPRRCRNCRALGSN